MCASALVHLACGGESCYESCCEKWFVVGRSSLKVPDGYLGTSYYYSATHLLGLWQQKKSRYFATSPSTHPPVGLPERTAVLLANVAGAPEGDGGGCKRIDPSRELLRVEASSAAESIPRPCRNETQPRVANHDTACYDNIGITGSPGKPLLFALARRPRPTVGGGVGGGVREVLVVVHWLVVVKGHVRLPVRLDGSPFLSAWLYVRMYVLAYVCRRLKRDAGDPVCCRRSLKELRWQMGASCWTDSRGANESCAHAVAMQDAIHHGLSDSPNQAAQVLVGDNRRPSAASNQYVRC